MFFDAASRVARKKPMRLYVGGFPYATTKEELTMLFSEVGEVTDIHLPVDRETRRPRGFGFIEMPDDAARAAVDRFNGTDFGGRRLTVNEAQPRAEREERPRGDFRPRHDDRPAAPAAPQLEVVDGGKEEEADMPSEDDMDMAA